MIDWLIDWLARVSNRSSDPWWEFFSLFHLDEFGMFYQSFHLLLHRLQKKTLKEEAEREKVSIPNDRTLRRFFSKFFFHDVVSTSLSFLIAVASLTKEYERLKQERMCKVCLVQESRTIFHPCGHLVCCAPCSDEVRTCPVCRAVILQKSRAYLVWKSRQGKMPISTLTLTARKGEGGREGCAPPGLDRIFFLWYSHMW